MVACSSSSSSRRSGPAMNVTRPSRRTVSASARRSSSLGSLSSERMSTETSRDSTRPAIRLAMCDRSHGTPANWRACVVSWRATQRTRAVSSASIVRAAAARLGPTNSSRAGASGSVTGNSYCPSTRVARKPDSAPTSTASRLPVTARTGPASGPSPSDCLATTGSSTRLHRAEVDRGPLAAVDRLGVGQGLRRRQPRVLRDQLGAALPRSRAPRSQRRSRPPAPARCSRTPPAPPAPPSASRPSVEARRAGAGRRAGARARRPSVPRPAATAARCRAARRAGRRRQ